MADEVDLSLLVPSADLAPVLNVTLTSLAIEDSWLELLDISSRDLLLVDVETLSIVVLTDVDLNGTVVGSLADNEANVLHLEHGTSAVRDVLVQVVRPGNVLDIDFCWSGHLEGGCLGVVVLKLFRTVRSLARYRPDCKFDAGFLEDL